MEGALPTTTAATASITTVLERMERAILQLHERMERTANQLQERHEQSEALLARVAQAVEQLSAGQTAQQVTLEAQGTQLSAQGTALAVHGTILQDLQAMLRSRVVVSAAESNNVPVATPEERTTAPASLAVRRSVCQLVTEHRCVRCGQPCADDACSRCNVAAYCDTECQVEDWKPCPPGRLCPLP